MKQTFFDDSQNTATVYICRIQNYSNATLSQKPQLQHQWAMALLKHAYLAEFGLNVDNLHPMKLANGKWICDKHYFSISHSAGLVAVAVSTQPVGVDIQKQTNADIHNISRRFFTTEEQIAFAQSQNPTQNFFFTWCKKEALWKSLETQPATVSTVETTNCTFSLQQFELSDGTFYLAATGNAQICFVEKL